MLERRLCVYNAGLKVDTSREILTVVMTSYYENVCSCKTHSSSLRVLKLTILFALSWPWVVSLDMDIMPGLLFKSCFQLSPQESSPWNKVGLPLPHFPMNLLQRSFLHFYLFETPCKHTVAA